jgi:hypothetical protein
MTDAQRAFWIDLLAMAGRSRFAGLVCAGEIDGKIVGYPVHKFQSLMSAPINVEETFALFTKTGKIRTTVTTEIPIKLISVEILNWSKFQSEYQRQKPYRAPLQRRLQSGDSQGDTQSNATEVEGEGEVDVEEHQHQARQARFLVPEWVPQEPWKDYLEMRRRKRVPNTERALKLAVTALTKLREDGNDPAGVLEQSIFRGWSGLFELRKKPGDDIAAKVSRAAARKPR